jgi:hypothetical protein
MHPLFRPGRVALLRALLGAALLVAPAAAAQSVAAPQGLPARISDSDFWKMTVDMSEPNGFFRSENFLSNEMSFQHPIPELVRTLREGGVYLGVGPEQNFTYIAAIKPRLAIIVDVRRGNTLGHLIYKALFEMSTDRADFLSRLFSRPRPAGLDSASSANALFSAFSAAPRDSMMYYRTLAAMKERLLKTHGFALSSEDLVNLEHIFDVFYEAGPELNYSFGQGNGGFGGGRGMPTYATLMVQDDGAGVNRGYLGSEATWRIVRDMEQKNLIVPLVGNFGGPKAIRAVGQYLKDHDAMVSAFYTSNVEQYLFQDGLNSNFYESVATLPIDSTSQFIRSGNRNGGGFGGGGRGPGSLSESLIAPIGEIVKAFKEGKLYTWRDVLLMSH